MCQHHYHQFGGCAMCGYADAYIYPQTPLEVMPWEPACPQCGRRTSPTIYY